MIFYRDDNNKEFDFSMVVENHDEFQIVNGNAPEFIDNEIINLLIKALEHFVNIEYRFVGFIDDTDMIINRCYKKNGKTWECLVYDDLQDVLKPISGDKILNCLMYEK